MRNAARTKRSLLWRLLPLIVLAAGGVACGGAPEPTESGGGTAGTVADESASVNVVAEAITADCSVPTEGCACADEGATVNCQGARVQIGNYVSCEPGKRTCTDGKWGPCVGRTLHEATALPR